MEEGCLIFFVNGCKNVMFAPDPEITLLQYLRTVLRLTGTKIACGEGGCGACTVMISYCLPDSDTVVANACLMPLCSLHGMAVTTVEGIGSLRTHMHPIQEQIAASHGSQCGFCTPGFVMSMYTLLRSNPTPSAREMETSLVGNLCRCTGYRPILSGFKTFTQECCPKQTCCRNTPAEINELRRMFADGSACNSQMPRAMDPSQEVIFPPFLKLERNILHRQSLTFVGPRVTWYRPTTLQELLNIKRNHPSSRIVIGNTEIGVEIKLKNQFYPVLVAATHIKELLMVERNAIGIKFGSSVKLTTLDSTLKNAIKDLPEEMTRVFSAFTEMLRWFAGYQIRNVASIGGNIMTASPISDLNTLLLACGAEMELMSIDGVKRTVKMDRAFFKGYRQTAVLHTDILVSVLIPFTKQNEFFYGYKQADRKEDDIATVNAGMQVLFDQQANITALTLAFGGMASTTIMATNTMQQLTGHSWNEDLLSKACTLLSSELSLDYGSPGGVEDYRQTLAVSFFFKFYLTVLQQLMKQGFMTSARLEAREVIATQSLERHSTQSSQWFEHVSKDAPPTGTLRQPIVHEAAYKQATGEAVYIDDMAPRQGELHLAYVLSSKAHALIVNVDPSKALTMPGVVDFVSHVDVQGTNWPEEVSKEARGSLKNEVLSDPVFAVNEVMCQGQIIGAILAETRREAQQAAKCVIVQYKELKSIITIADAITNESFFPLTPQVCRGNVEEALSRAEHVLEGEMHVEAQEHFYMETHITIAYPGEDGEMEVFSASQTLTGVQRSIALAIGVPANKVICHAKRLGGGFGGKENRSRIVAMPVAVAAMKHRRPVRCSLERDEDMMMTATRHPYLGKYKIGFSSSGKICALEVKYYLNGGCSLDLSYPVLMKSLLDSDICYMIPNLFASGQVCKTNLPSNTAFRGFGSPQAMLIVESAMTQVATYLKMEPEKLRALNMYKEGDITHYKQVIEQCNLQRCWDDCMQQSQFQERREEVNLFNSLNRWRKRGIAILPTKFGLSYFDSSLNQGGAFVNIYLDGSVLIAHGGVEMGQGLHTKVIQIASQSLQIPISKIRVHETATNTVPNTSPSAASVSSDLYGAATLDACNTLKERLAPIRAKLKDSSWEQLIIAAHEERVSLSATGFYRIPDVGYDFVTGEGRPYSYFTFGAACSEVEIDCLTGDHQILRTDIVMDVGKSLNPAIDIGQIEGGFMQGYGLMVLEQYKVRPDGTLLTRGPSSYKIPSVGNIPQKFHVTLLRESGNTNAVYSSKGIGEPPLLLASSVFFAIRDAISAARAEEDLDHFFRLDTPASPARIRMACCDRFTKMENKEKQDYLPWIVDL